jgi:hypothetical protein
MSESLDGSRQAQELAVRSEGRLGVAVLLAFSLGVSACSSESGSPSARGQARADLQAATTSTATLPPGVIARVGPFDILAERIALIVQAQRVSSKEARDLETRDALFASGALARMLPETPDVAAAVRGRLARAVLSKIAQDTAVQDPTDDEVAAATKRHFVELDRPEAFRVIHALAHIGSDADAAKKALARNLAERIKRAVASVKNPAEFRSRADAVDRVGLDVIIEELKPVAADGRVVD